MRIINTNTVNIYEYYVRGAAGQIMATYRQNTTPAGTTFEPEHVLYGAARLGTATPGTAGQHRTGLRRYELTDHLASVRATISDRRTAKGALPTILSATDYYPFGMAISSRSKSLDQSKLYTYGFGGQQISDEINANSYTAQFWQYDARIGRRLNLDPIDQFSISNYAAFANNPISNVDVNGDFKTEFRAKTYKFFHGGTVHQANGGVNDGQWFVLNKSGRGKASGSWSKSSNGEINLDPVAASYQRNFGWGGNTDDRGQRSFAWAASGAPSPHKYDAINKFEKACAGMLLSPLILATTQFSSSLWGLKATFSAGTQALVNKKIDVWDTGLDAFTMPGFGSAALNGVVDWNLNENGLHAPVVVGFNKSLSSAVSDATISLGVGALGSAASNSLPALKSTTEDILLETVISMPLNFVEKGTNQIISK